MTNARAKKKKKKKGKPKRYTAFDDMKDKRIYTTHCHLNRAGNNAFTVCMHGIFIETIRENIT